MLVQFGKGRGGAGGPADVGQPKFQAIQQVRAYWQALRAGDGLPRREQIDPRGMAQALECVFLLERIAPGLARFRLAGTHLQDLMGMDVRGMPLTALFDPQSRARLTNALEPVFAGPAGLDLWLEAERGIGRPALEARMLLLPLVGSNGEPGMALGCLATFGDLGRSPRRFAISRALAEPMGVLAPEQPAAAPDAAATARAPLATGAASHLRLVSSR